MKTKLSAIGCVALTLLAAFSIGCLVQSYQPFYTEQSKVPAPAVTGQWDLLKTGKDDTKEKHLTPWLFGKPDGSSCQVTAYVETNQAPFHVEAVFFKAGNQTFCDFMAGSLPEGATMNTFWMLHVVPVHSVWKVTLADDTLRLTPLNTDWLKTAVEQKKVGIPVLKQQGGSDSERLYTATPAEWIQFLEKFGSDEHAFATSGDFLLKRHLGTPENK